MANTERHSIRYGHSIVPFTIIRSSRRMTVSISVDGEDGVVVRAPLDASVRQLSDTVRARGAWVIQHLSMIAEAELPLIREFVTGESLLYLGKSFRLRVLPVGTIPVSTGLRGGWLEVMPSVSHSAEQHFEHIRAEVKAWYLGRAQRRIPERVSLYARTLGVPSPQITITDQGRRWGSCDRQGRLRINWRIIMAPLKLLDYVVAHELCHLRHPDHSARFWRELSVVMPDYEQRRQTLRRQGPRYSL